jgi:hypothetical protein
VSPYEKLKYALDIRPDSASGHWAPLYVLLQVLIELDNDHAHSEPNACDAFMARLRELVGADMSWLSATDQRLNKFRNRV